MNKHDDALDSRDNNSQKKGSGCITVFGSLFFLMGIAVLIFTVGKSSWESYQVSSWPTAEAQLSGPTFKVHSSSDDGTTYSLEFTATFDYNGQSYQTNRLNVWSDGDSEKQYYIHAQRRLERQVSHKGTATVYVKESEPTRSILDPTFRGKYLLLMITFGGLFAGIGLFIMIAGSVVKRSYDKKNDPNYARSTIRKGFGAKMGMYFFFAFVFITFSIFPATAFMEELEDGNHWIWLVLLFPLAGLGFLKAALHTWLEWRKFGDFVVTFDPAPARVGSDVTGIIPLNISYQPDQQYQISLVCVRRSRSSNSKNNTEKILWMEEGFARNESSVRGTSLRFAFAVPQDLPPTGSEGKRDITWRLYLQSSMPGIDLNRMVEIPVTHQSDDAPKPRFEVKYSKEEAQLTELPHRICQISQNEEGLPRFFFPAKRNRGTGCATFIFSLIFLASGIGVGYFAGIKEILDKENGRIFDILFSIIPIFMGVIFTLVGTLILLFGLVSIFGSLELNFSRTRTMTRTLRLPFYLKSKVLDLQRIKEITRKVSSSTQGGNKPDVTYRLIVVYEGKKITLADGLKGNLICDAVENKLREAINQAGGEV